MKNYPKRPFLISGHRYEQLWLVIPFCIFSIFCKGCGIFGAIIIFGIWFAYSIIASEQEWQHSCDIGMTSVHCNKNYLESQGFYENPGLNVQKTPKPQEIKTTEMNNQNNNIKQQKYRLQEMIIDHEKYMNLCWRWERHVDKEVVDTTVEQELLEIYYSLIEKRFKYIDDNVYSNYFIKAFGDNPSATGASFYLKAICPHIENRIRTLYYEINKHYGHFKYKYTIHQLYESIMNGGDIYGDD